MSAEIKVPSLGESVTSATVARWLKQPGEAVVADEAVIELETDKVSLEVNAPQAGVMGDQRVAVGDEVEVGAVLGTLDGGDVDGAAGPNKVPAPKAENKPGVGVNPPPRPSGPVARPATPHADVARNGVEAEVARKGALDEGSRRGALDEGSRKGALDGAVASDRREPHAPMPAAARVMRESGLAATDLGAGTGKDGRVTKGDVFAFLERQARSPAPHHTAARHDDVREQRVKMTRLRQTIARHLLEAQGNTAMLTTFNEVDMSAVIAMRASYKQLFEEKHAGAKLGYMSFFVRACCTALEEFPSVNAEIDGDEIVYRKFVNLGIAVGGPNGLVVPVLRDAQDMGFADIERQISDFGRRARDGALRLDELAGGTFSVTNGGIYGSLMSTPILNAPQSAILGMHKIQGRPVAIEGAVEIRPMMYLALSYDHRIIDGKEAVSFLIRVKDQIEDPRRLLLGL